MGRSVGSAADCADSWAAADSDNDEIDDASEVGDLIASPPSAERQQHLAAPNQQAATLGREIEFVYVRRGLGRYLPDFVLNLCFRKAHVVNMRLRVQRTPLMQSKARHRYPLADAIDSPGRPGPVEVVVDDEFRVFKLLALCAVTVAAGVGNNVTFVLMGNAMPGYPSFCLYFTTLLYVAIYFIWLGRRAWNEESPPGDEGRRGSSVPPDEGTPLLLDTQPAAGDDGATTRVRRKASWARVRKRLRIEWTSPSGILYLWVGVLVTFGGISSQFANIHVSGPMQALMNQLTLPLTALFAYAALKHKFTRGEWLGLIIVTAGALLPIVPQIVQSLRVDDSGHGGDGGGGGDEAPSRIVNSPIWLLVFFLSDVPSAIVNVIEERLFVMHGCDEVHYLAFTNLLTLFGYVACAPLDAVLVTDADSASGSRSGTGVLASQADGFRCFFGVHLYDPDTGADLGLPRGCEPLACVAVTGFVLCFCVYFYLLAVVVQRESASFQAVVNTLVTPMSTVMFASEWLMGSHAVPLDSLTIAAIAIIPIGIVAFKWHDFVRVGSPTDLLPLIARH